MTLVPRDIYRQGLRFVEPAAKPIRLMPGDSQERDLDHELDRIRYQGIAMGIALGLALIALSLIVYRVMANALEREKPPFWATHWLFADVITVAIVGLMAVGIGFVVDAVTEQNWSDVGAASVISAAVVIAAWFAAMRFLRPAKARGAVKP